MLEPICMRKIMPPDLHLVLGLITYDRNIEAQVEQALLLVPSSSPLYPHLPTSAEMSDDGEGKLVPRYTIELPTAAYLASRLFDILKHIFDSIDDVKWPWAPCLQFITLQRCYNGNDCGRDHLKTDYTAHLMSRLRFWLSLLPLAKHSRWLAYRFNTRPYEYNECRSFCRKLLTALR